MFGKKAKPDYRYVIWSDFRSSMIWPIFYFAMLSLFVAFMGRDPKGVIGLLVFGAVFGWAWWRFNGPSIAITPYNAVHFLAKEIGRAHV